MAVNLFDDVADDAPALEPVRYGTKRQEPIGERVLAPMEASHGSFLLGMR